eukprot:m.633502 g.633502  ORF g.633502 m.633502 type:complete len:88 (-) comp58300_c0_seq8:2068-2331(-)
MAVFFVVVVDWLRARCLQTGASWWQPCWWCTRPSWVLATWAPASPCAPPLRTLSSMLHTPQVCPSLPVTTFVSTFRRLHECISIHSE